MVGPLADRQSCKLDVRQREEHVHVYVEAMEMQVHQSGQVSVTDLLVA